MRKKTYSSTCDGIEKRGTPEQIEKHYEGMAYAARREGREYDATKYFQYADHWKRVKKGQI